MSDPAGPTRPGDPSGPGGAPTAVVVPPARSSPPPSAPTPDGRRERRFGRSRPRSTRVVVRKVAPWTVLRVSFFFYLCVWGVIVGAFVILYGVLGAIGALDSVTRLIRDLFADQSFEIHGDWLFTRGLLIAFGMTVLWTLINVFVALLYNLISDLVGGVEITLSERRK